MAKQRHLTRAPIAEAVVDIRASLPQGFDITELSRLPDEVSGNFQASESMKGFVGSFEFGKELEQPRSQAIDKGVVGYIYKSVDSTKVLQLRNDGFTLSKLKPYDNWSKLRDEARQLWNIYLSLAQPESISRIALRYINHLNIPNSADKFNFDEYLTTAPQIPNELPQAILSFFYRVVLPDPSVGAIAIINQAVESIADPKVVPIILDVDAFIQGNIEPEGDDIWNAFEKLHVFKNDIFFSCITEKTAELYE
jgi:uncharacterized protein (TIGR04255 family)